MVGAAYDRAYKFPSSIDALYGPNSVCLPKLELRAGGLRGTLFGGIGKYDRDLPLRHYSCGIPRNLYPCYWELQLDCFHILHFLCEIFFLFTASKCGEDTCQVLNTLCFIRNFVAIQDISNRPLILSPLRFSFLGLCSRV